MKICPDCHSNYTDDTLTFCLQDGTKLIAEQISETEFPTVAFGEKTERFTTKKDVNQIRFELQNDEQNTWNQSAETKIASITSNERKSNTLVAVLATILGMLILFGGAGFGFWFYFSSDRGSVSSASNDNSNSTDLRPPESKSIDKTSEKEELTTTVTQTPNHEATPDPEIDFTETKKEVTQHINAWKASSEAHDLDVHMQHYAEKVNYYNKNNVSRSIVKNDRSKAYEKYPVIKIFLSNMSFKLGAADESIIAEFDKEWLFQNDQKKSTGKVKSQLKLSKINGQWKITSEKDLKVYFVN